LIGDAVPCGGAQTTLKQRAVRFLADPALGGDREARITQVEHEIDCTGTYRQTSAEKLYGCKRAWAKHARCIGSPGWDSLSLVDLSDTLVDEQGIGHAARRHLVYATNNPEVNGGIRALITLVAVDRPSRPAPLIWNEQLIRYQSDPKYSALVAAVRRLGWVDEPDERFAPIPLVVQFPGRDPVLIPITPADFREVPLAHSRHPWFAELNLRWMTAPTISGMRIVIGGLAYACFFNGWYVLTEVMENLGAPDRYNQLPVIARHLGLLGQRTDPLWQDKASVVLLERFWSPIGLPM
jgi:nitric-oxide synthase, bacterial